MLFRSPHPSQSFLLHTLQNKKFLEQQAEKVAILKSRFEETKKAAYDQEYQEYWRVYPFNSGYFMCLQLKGVEAEDTRQHLLKKFGIGTISTGKHDLRIAFSSLEEESISDVFATIAQAVRDLRE